MAVVEQLFVGCSWQHQQLDLCAQHRLNTATEHSLKWQQKHPCMPWPRADNVIHLINFFIITHEAMPSVL